MSDDQLMMNRVHYLDCIEFLKMLPDDSVDSCVTDPPYGLEFMGKDWDKFSPPKTSASRKSHLSKPDVGPWGRKERIAYPSDSGRLNERCKNCGKWRISSNRCQCDEPEWEYRPRMGASPAMLAYQAWCEEWAKEIFRVLKPGAHLLAFSGCRTYHRLACAIEDAGFEIRDQIHWLYGCLSEDTEIFVNHEWKTYSELQEGDMVLGYDVESGSLCWQQIEEVVKYDYDDIAYRIKSEQTDQIVSRNHRVIVERDGQQSFVLAEELSRQQEIQIPILEGLRGLSIGVLNIQSFSSEEQDLLRNVCWSEYIRQGEKQRENGPQNNRLLCDMREAYQEASIPNQENKGTLLLIPMQRHSKRAGLEEAWSQGQSSLVRRNRETIPSEHKRIGKSSLEGRRDLQAFQGQLRRPEVRQMPSRVSINGEEGWLRDGTQVDCGSGNWQMPETVRGSPSYRPRYKKQLDRELDVILKQSSTQTLREARFTSTTMAMVEAIHYRGVMWCIRVPTGAFVARRNDLIFVTGNSGFPKGQNIGKRIDQIKGAKREVVGRYVHPRSREKGKEKDNSWGEKSLRRTKEGYDILGDYKKTLDERLDITGAASDEAKQWQGWNTQLKPAHEPLVLARKPISEKSIVDNVLIHGTGAINIDACRIAVNPDVDAIGKTTKRDKRQEGAWEKYSGFSNPINPMAGVLPSGRYPANLILSHHPDCRLIKEGDTKTVKTIRERDSPRMGKHGIYGKEHSGWSTEYDHDSGDLEVWACVEGCPVKILNEQSGMSRSSPVGFKGVGWKHSGNTKDEMTLLTWQRTFTDFGGAARFFYCAKPSVAERSMGLGGKRNVHITVKPLEIMRWLVRLITPRGGIVLDPFLGSGTTAIAAENEGCDWLGCDNNESYCKIAEARIKSLGGTQTRIIDFQDDGRKSETMKNEEKEIEI